MNRIFATVSIQSAIAAAIIAAAPAASAGSNTSSQPVREEVQLFVGADTFVSTADRAQVRAEARSAAASTPVNDEGRTSVAPARFVSTVSRDQVRAEAREAVRLGQTRNYEGHPWGNTEQSVQLSRAGTDVVAANKQ